MLTLWCCVVALGSSVGVQGTNADPQERFEGIARAAIADEGLSGLAVRIARDGKPVFSRAFGYLDTSRRTVESVEVPRAANAMFEPLVTTALLAMEERGQVDLERPLTDSFSALKFGAQPIRLSQLLSHTSGIPSFADFVAARGAPLDRAGVITWLADRPLDSEPGSCFAYSESNLVLASVLVERIGARPLVETLEQTLLEPLRLGSTSFRTGRVENNEAIDLLGERRELAISKLEGRVDTYSTLIDMVEFVQALDAGALIGPGGRRRLTEPLQARGEDLPFTHGFVRSKLLSYECLSFGGATSDSSVFVAWYPDANVFLALGTGIDTDALPRIERRLARALLNLPEPGIVDLPLSKDSRAVYLGSFYIGCTRVGIEEDGEQLFFVTPFDERHRLRSQGEHRFISASDPELILEFALANGRAESFLLIRRGTQTYGRRIDGA